MLNLLVMTMAPKAFSVMAILHHPDAYSVAMAQIIHFQLCNFSLH